MAAENPQEDDVPARAGFPAYREFMADREDLMRHKWLMSEKAGIDIGLESALLDWVDRQRLPMRKQRTK